MYTTSKRIVSEEWCYVQPTRSSSVVIRACLSLSEDFVTDDSLIALFVMHYHVSGISVLLHPHPRLIYLISHMIDHPRFLSCHQAIHHWFILDA